MKIIEKVHIDQFRGFKDLDIHFGKPVNAIIGRNGAMKTTLLGILAHPFSLETGEMSAEKPLIGGTKFNSPMSDKFKFSDKYDIAGEHRWTLSINPQIYPKGDYSCVSERRTDNNRIRFWSTEGRDKGMNYIQCPVIYLSMKRLLPIGEEKKISIAESTLTEEEKKIYVELHNKILIQVDEIKEVSSIESTNKHTLGPETEYSDAITISAGEDNVGRIILAVLSMKRLKEKYKNEYKGGIIFIDEIESTLYPAAQEKLLEFLFESAWRYELQFFFTTHSITTIRSLKTGKYHERAKVVALQKISGKITAFEDPSLMEIENDLNLAAGKKGAKTTNIKVYCEDQMGRTLAKALLPKYIKDHVTFVEGMDLSWNTYRTLYQHKVPEFLDNIILLDGDVRNEGTGWKNYPRNANIVLLPTEMAPERMLYETIFSLSPDNKFWDNSLGGYKKEVCFKDYPNHLDNIDDIKVWFRSQKDYAGKSYSKFINEWKKTNAEYISEFAKDFVRAYNQVATQVGTSPIDPSVI